MPLKFFILAHISGYPLQSFLPLRRPSEKKRIFISIRGAGSYKIQGIVRFLITSLITEVHLQNINNQEEVLKDLVFL